MFNNNNEIELTHKDRPKKELFNGANRFWKFVVSAEIPDAPKKKRDAFLIWLSSKNHNFRTKNKFDIRFSPTY